MKNEQSNTDSLLQAIQPKLQVVRGPDARGEYIAWCPFHPDGQGKPPHQPNLHFSERGFVCHACGEKGGLTELAERLNVDTFTHSKVEQTYDYTDRDGNLLFQVVRYANKEFRQRQPAGQDRWEWNLKGVQPVPYQLPGILSSEGRVYIVEGEKDVDSLVSLGLTATCNAGGAGNWKSGYSEYFHGREIVILPDNDNPGRNHAEQVAQFLSQVAAEVKIVMLPNLPDKGDVSDWLAAGGTLEQLEELAQQAQTYSPTELPARTIEILDSAPEAIRRPLCLVGGCGYAATWLWVKVETHKTMEKNGKVERHDPPIVEQQRVLAVVREDGQLFCDTEVLGALPLDELEVSVQLREPPPDNRIWNGSGVRAYISGQRPDARDVLDRIKAVVRRFMDFSRSLADEETMCEMVACYVIATYFLDAFNVIGYLWPNGDRGSGKTHFLHTVCEMAYLGQVILPGGTYATLRDMADYGATLAFDDAEGIMDIKRADPDKRGLLLAGNRRGATVPFKEPKHPNGWQIRHVHTYCPRLFSAIRLPDEVLASRSITIPLVRSGDPKRANADPLDYTLWPSSSRQLRDDLWAIGLSQLRNLDFMDGIVPKFARLGGRDLQPWRAILSVAMWLQYECGVDGIFGRIEQLSVDYQKEREVFEAFDHTRLVVEGLRVMLAKEALQSLTFETKELCQRVNELAVEMDLVGADDQFTSSKRIGHVLNRLRLTKETKTRNARRWRITRSEWQSLARAYSIDTGEDDNQPPETPIAVPVLPDS